MKVQETVITVLYFIVCIGIGIYCNKRSSKDTYSYFNAGGNVGMLLSVLAAFSAFASGGTILGAVGLAYNYGIGFTWSNNIGSICGFILAAVLVAPQLRKMKLSTISDFFKARFNWKPITVTCGIIIVFAFTAYLISQYKAAAITGQFLLGWNYNLALFAVAAVFVIYVSIGGMWAVTLTDAVQAVLMLIAMFSLAGFAITQNGGWTELLNKAVAISDMYAVNSRGVVPIIGCAFLWTTAICTEPHVVMRMCSSKNNKVARMTMGWAGLLFGLFAIGFFGVSAAGVVLFPPGSEVALTDSDTVFLAVMSHYFPAALRGLCAAAVMAAIMSTTDSILLAISASFSQDIVKNLVPSLTEKGQLRIAFWAVWAAGIIAPLFALNPPPLLTVFYSYAVSMFASGFFGPLILGIWWKKTNKYGALWGLIVGAGSFLLMYILKTYALVSPFTLIPLYGEMLISLPLGVIATFVGSLAHKTEDSGHAIMDEIQASVDLF